MNYLKFMNILKLKISQNKKIFFVGRDDKSNSLSANLENFLGNIDFINFDVYVYDELKNSLFYYLERNSRILIKTCPISKIDASKFDIMIYTSPLTHNILTNLNWRDENYNKKILPKKLPTLCITWTVWDGTIAHPKWVEIINKYFDAVMVPMSFLKDAYINSGVTKEIFILPNSVSFKNFLTNTNIEKKEKKPLIFCWSGEFSERKNVLKIPKAFKKAFGDRTDVKLILHTKYFCMDKNSPEVQEFLKIINNSPNIEFIEKNLDKSDYQKLICNSDVYIYSSMAEAFSITPRQALASGSILILSEIKAHKTITNLDENDGIFWCPIVKKVPLMQLDLNLGYQYDISIENLTENLIKAFNNKETLLSTNKIIKRRNEVKKFDKEKIGLKYKSILNPSFIMKSDKSYISDNGALYIKNEKLYLKFIKYSKKHSSLGKKIKYFKFLKIIYSCPLFFLKNELYKTYKNRKNLLCKELKILKILKNKKKLNQYEIIGKYVLEKNTGKHTYACENFNVSSPHTQIGSYCSIAANVTIGTTKHPTEFLTTHPFTYYKDLSISPNTKYIPWEYIKPVKIGNDVWIGRNVTIMDGIQIGDGVIIASGAVVTKDIPPYAIVGGIPAKILKYRFDENIIHSLLQTKWWELEEELIIKLPFDNVEETIKILEKIKRNED